MTRLYVLVLAAVASTSCFDPAFKEELRCSASGECPPGLSCGADDICRSSAPLIPDARPPDALIIPDASPVECTGDVDCQTPPNPCLRAGVCDVEAGVCNFGEVDCSALDGECTVGMCDPVRGSCVAVGANEDSVCGDGVVCGLFSDCAGFADGTCDSTGEQARTCTRNACSDGACVADEYTETAACTRVTDGVDCQTDTVTGCGACGAFSGTCDEGGSATCTCTDFKCQSDACTPVATSCSQPCNRDTDGVSCGATTETACSGCDYDTICDESAPAESCTCVTPVCVAGGCTGSTSASCSNSCARNTDGDECGCAACGSTGNLRTRICGGGTCSGTLSCGTCN